MYALNHLSLAAAGAIRYDFKKFIRVQIIATLIWTIFFMSLGYFFAHSLVALKHDIRLILLGILGVFFAWLVAEKFMERILKFFGVLNGNGK